MHDLATRLPYFERNYICLDSCKKGFLARCRPIISRDACHLKTKTSVQLMCAVGRDPNDEYFPFAYAVVEAKNKDPWTWFLNLLLVGIGDGNRWVFISDQQKEELQGRGRRELLPAWECIPSQQDHKEAKDGHTNSPAVGSAQPSSNDQPTVHRAQPCSNDDVTTSAPPPPTDNQSNPKPKRQRKRSAVTAETLNAIRNAARYMIAMKSAGR
nr:hypothetical protein CFP56_42521 [Quercus suber]